MATPLENLQTAEANLAAKIADVSINPKPTYSIDGQSVSHADYFAMLVEQQDKLRALILKYQGPFQVSTRGAV